MGGGESVRRQLLLLLLLATAVHCQAVACLPTRLVDCPLNNVLLPHGTTDACAALCDRDIDCNTFCYSQQSKLCMFFGLVVEMLHDPVTFIDKPCAPATARPGRIGALKDSSLFSNSTDHHLCCRARSNCRRSYRNLLDERPWSVSLGSSKRVQAVVVYTRHGPQSLEGVRAFAGVSPTPISSEVLGSLAALAPAGTTLTFVSDDAVIAQHIHLTGIVVKQIACVEIHLMH